MKVLKKILGYSIITLIVGSIGYMIIFCFMEIGSVLLLLMIGVLIANAVIIFSILLAEKLIKNK